MKKLVNGGKKFARNSRRGPLEQWSGVGYAKHWTPGTKEICSDAQRSKIEPSGRE